MASRKHSYRSTARTRRGAVTTFGSRTDVGCLRDHNEDSLVVAPPLFAVADGMGGHAAGEVASEIAVNVLSDLAPSHPDGEALAHAVEQANTEIIRAAHEGRGREGMGTTCTAAMLEGERLVIAQVGDSRAYLLHQGKLQQLTRDHSLMADLIEAGQITPEEARVHPQRSVITRALGSDPQTHPDLYELNVETGDRLLICSDGLSSMVRDEDIEQTMCHIKDPQRCASQLVNEAIAAGGHDNVTVIVANVTGFADVQRKKIAVKTKVTIAIVIALLLALIAGAVWATNKYLNTAAYLANDNGKVAIYRGVPGSMMGLTFSQHETTTDVNVSDLQPGVANRLNEGVRVDNMQAAEDLVNQYRDDAKKRAEGENAEAQQAAAQAEKDKNAADANAANGGGEQNGEQSQGQAS